ncbi:hypothetical protein ACEQ8H_006985 [Pleosporales sp. CAS-2024a]
MAAVSDPSDARRPPTAEELSQAFKVDVYDKDGKMSALGDLVQGKRTALVFIRHYWCKNCQAYVRRLSEAAPPASLPENTQGFVGLTCIAVLVIGCGGYQPIDIWISAASSKFAVYADPSNRLHALFKFKSTLSEGSGQDQRDYMQGEGGAVARWLGGIKAALPNVHHLPHVGPKAQNGGEVILSADGKCEFISRMQHTADHINVSELAELLGKREEAERDGIAVA